MQRLVPFIKDMALSGLVAQATRRSYRDDLAGLGLVAMAGFIFLIALIFCSLAAYSWLEVKYGAGTAFAIIGVVLFLLGGISFFAGMRIVKRDDRTPASHLQGEIKKFVTMVGDDLPEEILQPVKDHPTTALAAALLAGLILGRRI